jgi:hypothetical protein
MYDCDNIINGHVTNNADITVENYVCIGILDVRAYIYIYTEIRV